METPAEEDEEVALVRNPSANEIDPEDLERLRGDAIGNTMYSGGFIIKTILDLHKVIQQDVTHLTSDDNEEEENEGAKMDKTLERNLCTLWDMTTEVDVVHFLRENECLNIFTSIGRLSEDSRLVEILMGIVANMLLVREVLVDLNNHPEILCMLLDLTGSSDPPTLVQLLRLCNSVLSVMDGEILKNCLRIMAEHENFVFNLNFILKNSCMRSVLHAALELLHKICRDLQMLKKMDESDGGEEEDDEANKVEEEERDEEVDQKDEETEEEENLKTEEKKNKESKQVQVERKKAYEQGNVEEEGEEKTDEGKIGRGIECVENEQGIADQEVTKKDEANKEEIDKEREQEKDGANGEESAEETSVGCRSVKTGERSEEETDEGSEEDMYKEGMEEELTWMSLQTKLIDHNLIKSSCEAFCTIMEVSRRRSIDNEDSSSFQFSDLGLSEPITDIRFRYRYIFTSIHNRFMEMQEDSVRDIYRELYPELLICLRAIIRKFNRNDFRSTNKCALFENCMEVIGELVKIVPFKEMMMGFLLLLLDKMQGLARNCEERNNTEFSPNSLEGGGDETEEELNDTVNFAHICSQMLDLILYYVNKNMQAEAEIVTYIGKMKVTNFKEILVNQMEAVNKFADDRKRKYSSSKAFALLQRELKEDDQCS